MARTNDVWETAGTDGTYLQTISPSGFDILINGTSKYLNFNTTVGANGYGFRDNNGTMQVKNSGGSWANFGSGGAGTGDFVGPSSSTDNAIVRFDGTTGKLGQNSLLTISDTNTFQSLGDATALQFFAANATSSGTQGGTTYFYAGNGLGAGDGGNAGFVGGNGGSTGAGGPAELYAGNGGSGAGAHNGGDINLYAGWADTGSGNGGSINIHPGRIVNGGSGSIGYTILYKDAASSIGAKLDISSIASTTKTFTFPNTTGTLALTSDIKITIDTTAVTSGTAGRILFESATNKVSESANLFWDNTNAQQSIGGRSSYVSGNNQIGFSLLASNNSYYGMVLQNQNAGDSASTDYLVSADNDTSAIAGHYGDFGIQGSGFVASTAGVIKTVSINTAGTGYTAGDVVTVTGGGDANAQITILTVSAGIPQTISIFDNGSGYTVTNFTTTGGTGTGFKVNVLTLYDTTGLVANDIYLLGVGGNLIIGTDDTVAAKTIKFLTGGLGSTNKRMELTDTGLVLGLASTLTGALSFKGITSGTAILTVASAAGTPTITLPGVTGTLALTSDISALSSVYQPLDSDLTAIAGLTATTDNFIVSVSSAWASRTPAQVKTTLVLNNVENTALSTWAGSANITTLGTIGTGTWQGGVIGSTYGGTGVNNAGRTLTLNTNSGTIAFSAASKTLTIAKTLTLDGTDSTTMTFPTTSKTIAANDGTNWTFSSQAIGDIIYASSTTAFTRLAAVAVGQVLVSAGTGTAPAYSANPQVTTIELGNASDTTLSRSSGGVMAVEGVVIPSISSTNTITNKRNQPRIISAASYTTDTGTSLDVSTTDIFVITAQAGALKFNNPSGTPVQGEKLIVRIKDNGTARALTYDTQFRALGNALPSTTVLSKTLYLGLIYNSTDTKWDLIAVAQEA